jgi:D-alanyl-D-alanine carboxypeptidase/D-alanyl-D-alanine-endopeptidase (penicillin-binding protein 4)
VTTGRRFVAVATISALVAVSGCAVKAAQPEATTLRPLDQLHRDLDAIFDDPATDHAQWSVAVGSIARGDALYRRNAQRLQVPASSQKLLTTAVAADRLGWDYRYATTVHATGPIDGGVLNGDLVVSSNGDPTINPRHLDRFAAFDDWARQLADRGLRRISGAIIGNDNAFAEPGWGLGWSWDDIPLGYGAQVGALQYNESQVEMKVEPAAPGRPAIVVLSPASSGLALDPDVTTGPTGSETRILVDRALGSSIVTVRGQIASSEKATQAVAVANPTQQYVNALRVALELRGIVIDGPTVDIDELATPPSLANATLLIDDRSAPLMEIIAVTLKFSRNIYAETLLRSLAPAESPRTTEAGLQVLRETLLSWGIPNEGYLARDGSGLSRYDWITADTIVKLLMHVAKDRKLADRFRQTLAVPGEPGTLENRMVDTPLQTRVRAKTGSMSQVRSLSGYLTTAEGEPLVFSIIVNGFRVPGRDIDAVMEHALGRLVEFRR